jgi:membrane peptidoglycan carboxypeptidase
MPLRGNVVAKKSMKKIFKYTGMALVIIFVPICAYYLCSLYEARKYTREIISLDLEKAQWRYPNGAIKKFDMFCHDLSKRQTEILIKVQDPGFYHHNGIDLSTPGAGLTTITQAIAKKLYFDNFKPGIAKIKQTLIARFVLNELISKDEQLTLFINTMYFGNVHGKPVIGLESAANTYFHQTVKNLTEDQYISLIAMIVMPGTFHLIDHPEWNMDRCNRIKALIAGEYKPKGLMDQFYGTLPQEVIHSGLPPASYFGDSTKAGNDKAAPTNKANATDKSELPASMHETR